MTAEIFNYVLSWLITFGIAWITANTHGPFALFERARHAVQRRYPEDSWQHVGVECPACIGFWVGIPVAYFMGGGFCLWISSVSFVTLILCVSPD